MLKFNKFLLGTLTILGLATTSTTASAEIVDTLEYGTDFYLLETLTDGVETTNTLYRYDMAAAGSQITTVLELTVEVAQVARFDNTIYLSAGKSLWSFEGGVLTHIRNVTTDAIELIATENHLIMVQGDPGNGIFVFDNVDGTQVDRTPIPAEPDDFYAINGMFHDTASGRLVIQLTNADDNPDALGSQYLEATFDDNTGNLGALSTISINDDGGNIDAPNGLDAPIFLDDFLMAVDEKGYVVDFNGLQATLAHASPSDTAALSADLAAANRTATDSVIDAAADNSSYTYFAWTLDNPCNPIGTEGTRITRRERSGNRLVRLFNGYLNNLTYYYDTTNSAHSLASTDNNLFLFYGEGSELAVEVITDSDFSYPYFPWSNADYAPSQADMSNVRQSTSFAIDDETIAMQIESGCDHYVGFWNTTSSSFSGYTETFWFDAQEGAYVEALDRIFIAFSDGTNQWITHMRASTLESADETEFSLRYGFGEDEIHQIIDAGNFLVINRTLASGADHVASHGMTDFTDNISGITVRTLATETDAQTNDSIPDCCSPWTSAVYSNNKIYFTTDEGLYAMNFDGNTGVFSGPVERSIDYGGIHTIPSAAPFLSVSSDGSLLFVDSEIYDSTTLRIVDSVGGFADVGLFTADGLVTIDLDASTYETSLYSDGSPDLLDAPDSTTVNGELVALLPIVSGGVNVPLTLSTENGALNITIDGTQSATTGSSSGTTDSDEDGDNDDDSGNDGGCAVTNQCVQAPGGGGGGSIDWLLLMGLAGLGLRQIRKSAR